MRIAREARRACVRISQPAERLAPLAVRGRQVDNSFMSRHRALAIGLATISAVVLAATAGADPGPGITMYFAVSHQRPVAGQMFTGLTITDTLLSDPITVVSCDASIGRKHLPALQHAFYIESGKDSVVCSWRIPAGTAGKRLWVGQAKASTKGGFNDAQSQVLAWRIRPPGGAKKP